MKKIKSVKKKRPVLYIPQQYGFESYNGREEELEIHNIESIKPHPEYRKYTRSKAEKDMENSSLIKCTKCRKIRWALGKVKSKKKEDAYGDCIKEEKLSFNCNFCGTHNDDDRAAYNEISSKRNIKGRIETIRIHKNAKDT